MLWKNQTNQKEKSSRIWQERVWRKRHLWPAARLKLIMLKERGTSFYYIFHHIEKFDSPPRSAFISCEESKHMYCNRNWIWWIIVWVRSFFGVMTAVSWRRKSFPVTFTLFTVWNWSRQLFPLLVFKYFLFLSESGLWGRVSCHRGTLGWFYCFRSFSVMLTMWYELKN